MTREQALENALRCVMSFLNPDSTDKIVHQALAQACNALAWPDSGPATPVERSFWTIPTWRPIRTAPRDGTEILAVCRPTVARLIVDAITPAMLARLNYINVVSCQDGQWRHTLNDCPAQPTDWMPLPSETGNPISEQDQEDGSTNAAIWWTCGYLCP